MRWIFFILLLASFGAQAQNKEAKSFFISAKDGFLLGGQKTKTVGSGAELDYDSKISFVNGVNIGYVFNSVALDMGISYYEAILDLNESGSLRTQSVCSSIGCVVGERKNVLVSLGGTAYFLSNKNLVKPYLTLRAGMSRSHVILNLGVDKTVTSEQGIGTRANAGVVISDSKSFVPFAQIGAGIDLSYGLGVGYKFMWLGSHRVNKLSGLQDELELKNSFNHIAELRLTLPFN